MGVLGRWTKGPDCSCSDRGAFPCAQTSEDRLPDTNPVVGLATFARLLVSCPPCLGPVWRHRVYVFPALIGRWERVTTLTRVTPVALKQAHPQASSVGAGLYCQSGGIADHSSCTQLPSRPPRHNKGLPSFVDSPVDIVCPPIPVNYSSRLAALFASTHPPCARLGPAPPPVCHRCLFLDPE
jgi:hypothetical protein